MADDPRIVWVRAAPGRKIIQEIEAMPCGFSVITRWHEGGIVTRQDCELSITDGTFVNAQTKEN